MAAIPSSGSLVATHDYYRRRLGSTSSSSSCGSAEFPGDAECGRRAGRAGGTVTPLPPPGLPKADPGHWWASFFFGKSAPPFMAPVLESPERSAEPPRTHSSGVTGGQAAEALEQQPARPPS